MLESHEIVNLVAGSGPVLAVALAFGLGMLHGVTPDEHTWPITFSYTVGSYSSRGGMRVGLLFSLTFALQRALASELAYFAVNLLVRSERLAFALYAVVGVVMLVPGWYVLQRRRKPSMQAHSDERGNGMDGRLSNRLPWWMPMVHGFVAGWGTGAFALIVYTVLAPAMPSPLLGFVPGLVFGLGTAATQVVFGALIGSWIARRHVDPRALAAFASRAAARTLLWGGAAFVAVGAAGVTFPALGNLGIDTGLHVLNLSRIDAGFLLAVLVPFGFGGYAVMKSLHEAGHRHGYARAAGR